MSFFDIDEQYDEETDGMVAVRGPFDALDHRREGGATACEGFEVLYGQGNPPMEFTVPKLGTRYTAEVLHCRECRFLARRSRAALGRPDVLVCMRFVDGDRMEVVEDGYCAWGEEA